jgi:hypothetical protein
MLAHVVFFQVNYDSIRLDERYLTDADTMSEVMRSAARSEELTEQSEILLEAILKQQGGKNALVATGNILDAVRATTCRLMLPHAS